MGDPLGPFERIFVINLATRVDRRRETEVQLRRIGLSLESDRVERFDAIRPDEPGDFPSVGARGCFLSHLGVLRRARASNLRSVLVLEDDVDFVEGIASALEAPMHRLRDASWSIFYGGGRMASSPRGMASGGCVALDADEEVGTSHFYGLRGEVVGALADYLELLLTRTAGHPEGGPMHVDGAFCWFRRLHPRYRTLMAVPELGYQRLSRTDIHALRWYDKSAPLRPVLSVLRRGLRAARGAGKGG
jgi:glycosyl transferase, family 25